MPAKKRAPKTKVTDVYKHAEAELLMRPKVAVKVIDQRGNELLVLKGLKEAN